MMRMQNLWEDGGKVGLGELCLWEMHSMCRPGQHYDDDGDDNDVDDDDDDDDDDVDDDQGMWWER